MTATTFFFNDFPLFLTSCKQQLDAFSDLATVKGHKYLRKIFTPVVHTVNRKTWCRAHVWSIKAGKISKNRNKQTSDQEHEKNCTVAERKEIRAVCVLTPRLFSHSTLSSRLGRYKGSYYFLFCLWEFIFSSHESKRCWTVHSDKQINYYSVGIRAKQSGTVKNVEHSKNDYHECSKQVRKDCTVETLMQSGRKRSFTNRDRNALKRLVKSNRWLTLQDITAKLNECKTNTFSQKTVQRVLYSEGYKRGLAKKKMVVREANQKKRV